MRISKWGEYGILCCLYMAKQAIRAETASVPVGAAELAYAQSIPLQYTQQILQKLRKGNIITSVRGPGGGYCLNKKSSEINLRDILVAAEGDTLEIICEKNSIFASCSAAEKSCSLKNVWHELRATIDTYLMSKSLDELAQEEIASENEDPQSLIPMPSMKAS